MPCAQSNQGVANVQQLSSILLGIKSVTNERYEPIERDNYVKGPPGVNVQQIYKENQRKEKIMSKILQESVKSQRM